MFNDRMGENKGDFVGLCPAERGCSLTCSPAIWRSVNDDSVRCSVSNIQLKVKQSRQWS